MPYSWFPVILRVVTGMDTIATAQSTTARETMWRFVAVRRFGCLAQVKMTARLVAMEEMMKTTRRGILEEEENG